MKLNIKGFTLVELMGVIIILSLLVILAAPPIIEKLKSTEKEIDEANLKIIASAVDLYIDDNSDIYKNVNGRTYCIALQQLVDDNKLNAPILNAKTSEKIDLNTLVEVKLVNNNKEIRINNECQEYSEPAAPELSIGMIPIVHNGTNWVKADTNSEWYDYNSKEWANVVLVTDASRLTYQSAAAGTIINEADVLAYLVWIPRYRYKLFNIEAVSVTPQTIEVIFEDKWHSKSTGNANEQWLTHPAFTFGNSEVNGFWVGKFETTGNTTTPTIKPNNAYLGGQLIATQFATAQKFNNTTPYGTTSDFDSHMMKNTEWGAVAYLTQSVYGKNSEVWKNNSSALLTGCAGNSFNEPAYNGCQNAYNTAIGVNASTTGNIYGIYDMSGGAWEYVMGGMYNIDNTTVISNLSGFEQAIIDSEGMRKYINKYTYGTTYNDQDAYNRRQLGDATGETRGWNNDRSFFSVPDYPWFIRGGCHNDSTDTGVFASSSLNNANGIASFRVVQLKP